MDLKKEDIEELIRQFLILRNNFEHLEQEKRELNIVIDCKDEEIKTLKEIINIKK